MLNKSGYHCKGNVMTPVNWFGGVFEVVLIPTAASQHNNWVGVACIILASFMILAYLGIYIYFLITSPDRLQSEEYNLYQQELSIDGGPITIASSQHAITKALPNDSSR